MALAREVYARPFLLILDDVFGSLDAMASSLIFERQLGRAGLARRLGMATILVTTAGKSDFEHSNNFGAET